MVMLYFSGRGDYVLDPFSGIGTTVISAAIFERKYLCFEKDKNDRQRFYDAVQKLNPELKDKFGNIDFGYDVVKDL
ncbi:MAG: site-specific DNA-methyltransferase [Ruminococcus sp.]|nr:site-specific DNA-methyltransferase [Ruminococcus sp.]